MRASAMLGRLERRSTARSIECIWYRTLAFASCPLFASSFL